MKTASLERVFCALDTTDRAWALRMATTLGRAAGGVKLGLEYYGAHGPAGVLAVSELGVKVFLDLKFHDIPNQVAGAVRSVIESCRPFMLTVHAAGGRAMLKAASEAAAETAARTGAPRPLVVGVTVLTSLDAGDLQSVGQLGPVTDQVERLAELAIAAGLDGLVCSAEEAAGLRQHLGSDPVLVVPGIRPAWSGADDQKRIVTPAEAVRRGASYLVIGRPITRATDPADALRRIGSELAEAA
ncbi:MAG: orotidine-5'-phosphate decarboxylase [Proteobacteria bacterium]|nr:orotidine-5'-phosphate decarboxylase [Pseudomonadota bacterium]